MYIVMVSSECAPLAKVGGLGDFVQGLSRELQRQGHHLEVILPDYDHVQHDSLHHCQVAYHELWVPFYQEWIRCTVRVTVAEGLRCYLIAADSVHGFFKRGFCYGAPDDAERFAFFSRAVLEFLYKSGKQPDILHCQDWQTALVPVLLTEMYRALGLHRPKVCYTLHNLGHQGLTGDYVLRQVGLDPARLMTPARLQDRQQAQAVNLMQGGIVYAQAVTTVSPRYAWEVQHSEQGQGLQGVLQEYAWKFTGILNGLDYDIWNPAHDPHLTTRYGPDTLADKYANKQALRRRFWLQEAHKPIVAVVSRLDYQKGGDLMIHALHESLRQNAQFVLLGAATDAAMQQRFQALKQQFNDNPDCHLELAYDEALAHQIYAGADILVIPSIYEPCGLTQMMAMKYGVVPVVRRTGGLADTVFDANYADQAFHQRNGYVFNDYTPDGLESALHRAIGLWHQYPAYFRQLRLNGMHCDYSWYHPAQRYLQIYAA